MWARSIVIAGSLLAGAAAAAPATCLAGGEHGRRAAAELLVLAGDAHRLADARFSALQNSGLQDRLRGGLSGLDLLLRLADQERGLAPEPRRGAVEALRRALRSGDLGHLREGLGRLVAAYPLRVPGILPAGATAKRLRDGRSLHAQLCAACHDEPDLEVARPAYDLFAEARRLAPAELAARLIVGVRGDRVTGVGNPLSDEQIAALMAYYRSGAP